MNGIFSLSMVQCVFYDIADGFIQPVRIASQRNAIVSGEGQDFVLLLRLYGKTTLDVGHQLGQVLLGLLQCDRARVQLGDFQQILHKSLDAVELLLGQGSEFSDSIRIGRFLLQNAVVDIERCQRGFELV